MGKTGKWLKSFLTGKKEKEKGFLQQSTLPDDNQSTPIPLPMYKEKRRWSFWRSAGAGKELNSMESTANGPIHGEPEADVYQKRHVMEVAAAAEAAVAAAQAAVVVARLSSAAKGRSSAIEEAAAINIQAVFRSHLARKALRALKGLVKLQALVRGHLVRKQATATLRCMQALVTVQARARAQRICMVEEAYISQRRSTQKRSPSPYDTIFQQAYEMDRNMENIKIVEMDPSESKGSSRSRSSYSISKTEKMGQAFSSYYGGLYSIGDDHQQISPAPSAFTDMSPGACSGHFEEFFLNTVQSSPQCFTATPKPDYIRERFTVPHQEDTYSISNDYPFCPNYMANTESSRAKARSQSAPKQRLDTCEWQPTRRRPSLEGRNIPKGVRMQRSSSQTGSSLTGYQYPWSIKLDRSNMSLKDSECGSTSTVLTNNTYCRSLAPYEVHRTRY